LVQAFESLAVRKNIKLNFNSEMDSKELYIDVDKFEKIINNLLSNAFKFTPEYGNIEILVYTGEAFPGKFQKNPETFDQNASPQQSKIQNPISKILDITISNTGPGIPPDKIDKIFDRFYQIDDSYTKDEEGTGIGLALTKELVELHHGTIDVQCNEIGEHPPVSLPVGDSTFPYKSGSTTRRDPLDRMDLFQTTFTVSLHIGNDHLAENEIIQDISDPDSQTIIVPESLIEDDPRSNIQYPTSNIKHQISKPLVLVVEDNADLRQYIRSNMDGEYQIKEAENGEEGFKKATNDIPDLIISDVMMPKIDGFEFCDKIKTDERTSHIPVILLTARDDMESKIEGLEFGADDYISKPFEVDELKVRSKNLIEQRKKLREKFSKMIELNPADITASSRDEQFLQRLLTVFEKHRSESGYSTENFAREVGMSRSQLNRKLRALINLSTHGFILNLRLKKAAQLLKKTAGSVSEIAYTVGFNNPANFAKAFRRQYGQSPSDFAKEKQ
jgi:DNA-binding response OmpR family regulator